MPKTTTTTTHIWLFCLCLVCLEDAIIIVIPLCGASGVWLFSLLFIGCESDGRCESNRCTSFVWFFFPLCFCFCHQCHGTMTRVACAVCDYWKVCLKSFRVIQQWGEGGGQCIQPPANGWGSREFRSREENNKCVMKYTIEVACISPPSC